jgi:putative DNA primase/helicase
VTRRQSGRVPPSDVTAERALLGAMLHAAGPAIAAAQEHGVTSASFYQPVHGHVAEAIFALHTQGGQPDPVTVAAELTSAGIAVDLADLTAMVVDVPSSRNAGGYAQVVARMHAARQLIAVGAEITEMGYAIPEDASNALDRAQVMLGGLEVAGRSTFMLRPFAEIEAESVEWVWHERIPRRAVTIMAGDPGVGKSFVTVALAAGLSVGAALPAAESTLPVGTLLVSYEDDAGVTIKQRLAACGADERHVHYLDGVVDGIGIRTFRPEDAPRLEAELARRPEIGLVIIDPVGSLLAGKLDTARDNEVRGALQPLVDLARRANVAVLAVMHLRKEDSERAIYRVGGSVGGFVGLARSVLLVGREQSSGRRAVAHPKCNVGRETESVEYTIEAGGRFYWKGVDPALTAERLLSGGGRATKRQDAAKWLKDRLAGGMVLCQTVISEAEENGISYATLRRAFEDVGADSVQLPVPGKIGRGPAYWFDPQVTENPLGT